MNLAIETEQETDGRWIAEIPQIPGALAYGKDRDDAIARVEALALRIMADRLEHGEVTPELDEIFSVAGLREENIEELNMMASILRGRANIAAGRFKSHEEVKAIVTGFSK